jgi:hypothetical protein
MKKYVEFNKQDYYGLVTVDAKEEFFIDEAAKIYIEKIAGELADDILNEGEPRVVTKEYAFWKFANCKDCAKNPVGDLLREFNDRDNDVIVIDGSLV